MSRFQQIRDRLPTLYRPDRDNSSSLLTLILRAAGSALDEADNDATTVLQSHWFQYADAALFQPFFTRSYQLQKKPLPAPTDNVLDAFPYIHDLARLAALLPAAPWREPASSRELVEQFRTRLERIVKIYRNGLGTAGAVRAMVEAQLPPLTESGFDAPVFFQDPGPVATHVLRALPRGEPPEMVGPLMRWTIANPGHSDSAPTLYIEGVTPDSPKVEATDDPAIELYAAGGRLVRTAIGYRGKVEAGKALRLKPAYASWLQTDKGLLRAEHASDPTAPGPWSTVEVDAAGATAVQQSADKMLWASVNVDGKGALRRFDGGAWTTAVEGFAEIRCLQGMHDLLWIGAADGLHRMPLHPNDGFTTELVVAGIDVQALLPGPGGSIWVGTASGAVQLLADGTSVELPLTGVSVRGIYADANGIVYFSSDLGLFQMRPDASWYWYAGDAATEQAADWHKLEPGTLPSGDQVFLPPCLCTLRDRQGFLWIGTAEGVARYGAYGTGGLTFETSLEAFPDLGTGKVFAIKQDERGVVWFAAERGLFRHDGRDWWQHQGEAWVHLGRSDTIYGDSKLPRGSWRFQRSSNRWERFDTRSRAWLAIPLKVRSIEQSAVLGVTWTDQVAAAMGTWDGTIFAEESAVPASELVLRYKIEDRRIVMGGIPAIPRLSAGSSVWRYLQLEPAELPAPDVDPFWTTEGRLITVGLGEPETAEGRYDTPLPPPPSDFDEAVFAYPPAARVWFEWQSKGPLTFLVRLKTEAELVDDAILDRVWQGIQQVRPAGVQAALAVEEEIVRGYENG